MKVCPACRTSYDDSQNFCLNDGTPLLAAGTEPETETIIVPEDSVGRRGEGNLKQPPWEESQADQSGFTPSPPIVVPTGTAPPPAPPVPQPRVEPPRKSNVAGIIAALSALAVILLVGAWWLLSPDNNQTQQNQTRTTNATSASPTVANTNGNANVLTGTNARQPANTAIVAVSNQTANQTASAPNSPAPTKPAAPPSVSIPPASVEETNAPPEEPPQQPQRPPLSGREAATARRETRNTLSSWIAALEAGDLDQHITYYADSVQYYRERYNRNQILADKQRAVEIYDDIQFNVSNVRYTNLTADTATILYDKEWRFTGSGRSNEGKVLSQLTLTKIGDRWLITGERDLRVYYTRNS